MRYRDRLRLEEPTVPELQDKGLTAVQGLDLICTDHQDAGELGPDLDLAFARPEYCAEDL